MKNLILEILKNPITLPIVVIFVSSYALLFLLLIRRSYKFAELAERGSARFFIFCQSQIMLTPFIHWNLHYLVAPPMNKLIAYSQIFVYIYLIIALFPLIKNGLSAKNVRIFFISSFQGNPFLWLLPILATASFLWSKTPFITLRSGLILLLINIFSVYIATRFDWDDILNFVRWNIAAIAILSVVVRRSTNDGTTLGGGLAGVLPSKNTLGGLMALGFTLWLLHFFYSSKNRAISASFTLLCLVMILQAKSAGAYMILAIMIAIILLGLFLRNLEFRSATVLTSVLFLITIFVSFATFPHLEWFLGLFGKDMSFTGRDRIWPVIFHAASQKLWLGYGALGFWQPWRGSESPALGFWDSIYWVPSSAHQGFLDVLLQLGAVGLMLMIFSLSVSLLQSFNLFFKFRAVLTVFPLTIMLHQLLINLLETRFLSPNAFWLIYTIVAFKLSISYSSSTYPNEGAKRKMESFSSLSSLNSLDSA